MKNILRNISLILVFALIISTLSPSMVYSVKAEETAGGDAGAGTTSGSAAGTTSGSATGTTSGSATGTTSGSATDVPYDPSSGAGIGWTWDLKNELAIYVGESTGVAIATAKLVKKPGVGTVQIGSSYYSISDKINSVRIGEAQVFDLSWISKTKDAQLAFTVNGGKAWTLKTIKAQEKSLKVAFSGIVKPIVKVGKESVVVDLTGAGSPVSGYVYFTYNASGSTILSTGSGIEWRKGTNTDWKDISTLPSMLPLFVVKGTTLYFRVISNSDSQWPGKEIKYSFKKEANASKLTVDIAKNKVSLSKGQIYRLILASGGACDWISVDQYHMTNGKLDNVIVQKLRKSSDSAISAEEIMAGFDIEVRKAATDKALPSAIFTVHVGQSPAIPDTGGVGVASGSVATVTLKDATDKTSGIVLTNKSGLPIQYALVPSGTSINSVSLKWKDVKAGGTGSVSKNDYAKKGEIDMDLSIGVRYAGIKGTTAVTAPGVGVLFPISSVLGSSKPQSAQVAGSSMFFVTGSSVDPSDGNILNVTLEHTIASGAAAAYSENEVTISNLTKAVSSTIAQYADASFSKKESSFTAGALAKKPSIDKFAGGESSKAKLRIDVAAHNASLADSTTYWIIETQQCIIRLTIIINVQK